MWMLPVDVKERRKKYDRWVGSDMWDIHNDEAQHRR